MGCVWGRIVDADAHAHLARDASVLTKLNDTYRQNGVPVYMLPMQHDHNLINNLYPDWDKVDLWNIFIIGNDKTYILANIKTFFNQASPPGNAALNNNGVAGLDEWLQRFLDPLWDVTLQGHHLHFVMLLQGRTYVCNSYPFRNQTRKVIGAILLIRLFDTFVATRVLTPEDKTELNKLRLQHEVEYLKISEDVQRRQSDEISRFLNIHDGTPPQSPVGMLYTQSNAKRQLRSIPSRGVLDNNL